MGSIHSYTDAFGNTKTVQERQDFQLQKVQVKFLGWVLDPKLRYFIYTWTSNPTQGQGAQVVVAGNVGYTFNEHFTLAAGITSLPGVRTTEGNFPFWLGVDSRHDRRRVLSSFLHLWRVAQRQYHKAAEISGNDR